MQTATGRPFHLAWNRLDAELPLGFHVTALGRSSLRAERGPDVVELSWKESSGIFDLAKEFERIQKTASGVLAPRPAEAHVFAMHPQWKIQGYTWQDGDAEGSGLLGYDPGTRHSLLATWRGTEGLPGQFSFHVGPQFIPWAIYDVLAEVPSHLGFNAWVLEPGIFRLSFVADGQRLVLHRFNGADSLLRGRDIESWSAKHFRTVISGRGLVATTDFLPAGTSIRWQAGQSSRLAGLWRRLSGRRGWVQLVAWQPADRDVLLVVEGYAQQEEPDWFSEVCRKFQSVAVE